MWFEPPEKFDRRRDENKLKRIAKESEQEETGKIDTWLNLAKRLFDKDRADDDDVTPTAA